MWTFIKQNPQYLVSSQGQVKNSKTGRILKPFLTNRGYYILYLYNPKTKPFRATLHRLVAQAFIPNPKNKPCINHKNYNRTDNRPENLEWVTYSENNKHQWLSRLNKKNHNWVKLFPSDVDFIKTLKGRFRTIDIAKFFGVSVSSITNIWAGKTWTRELK